MKHSISALAVLSALSALPAFAQSGAEIGVLTCKVQEVSNVILYTTQDFLCEFKPSQGEVEAYSGKISKIGIDLSIKEDFTIIWAVVAPSDNAYKPRALVGTYAGAGADVALGAGIGAKVLVGGGENSFSLQPVSVAGVTGGGASVGIEKFELK